MDTAAASAAAHRKRECARYTGRYDCRRSSFTVAGFLKSSGMWNMNSALLTLSMV